MLGLNISCSSKSVLALIWPVGVKKHWLGCLGDEEGGCICYVDFLYYNLQLTFIPFYVHFICNSVFYVWPWCH